MKFMVCNDHVAWQRFCVCVRGRWEKEEKRVFKGDPSVIGCCWSCLFCRPTNVNGLMKRIKSKHRSVRPNDAQCKLGWMYVLTYFHRSPRRLSSADTRLDMPSKWNGYILTRLMKNASCHVFKCRYFMLFLPSFRLTPSSQALHHHPPPHLHSWAISHTQTCIYKKMHAMLKYAPLTVVIVESKR